MSASDKQPLTLTLSRQDVGKLLHAPSEVVVELIRQRIRETEATPPPAARCNCGEIEFQAAQTFAMTPDGVRHRSTESCWREMGFRSEHIPTGSRNPNCNP